MYRSIFIYFGGAGARSKENADSPRREFAGRRYREYWS